MKEASFSKALNRTYRLLSIRERSENEIKRYLKEKGYGAECIDEVVGYLKEKKLLDDMRFAQSWIKDRSAHRPKGIYAIRDELHKKGVKKEIVEAILKDPTISYNEYELAKTLADKKIESSKKLSNTKRKKIIYSYLARRGFSFDVINDIIDNI